MNDRALFVVVAFEGPDPYSQAGGLAARVTGLVDALVTAGNEAHLFFIGDPHAPGEERSRDGRLTLHRWSQWISENCPRGVYDGEAAKVADLCESLPSYLAQRLVAPAIRRGRIPIVLFEEWQTAECACRVSEALRSLGLRDRAVLAWNANSRYGFEQIDWLRLSSNTMVTAISRHMRNIVRSHGADACVIPNGIPVEALERASASAVARLRTATSTTGFSGFLFKMAPWNRDQGWPQALDAIARMPDRMLIARPVAPEGAPGGLTREAEARGLRVVSFSTETAFVNGLAESARSGADVVTCAFGLSAPLARALFAAADGVLANAVSEPFGLFALEAMAAGGLAFTGGTGEDYAVPGRNAIVLESLDPREIVAQCSMLAQSPRLGRRLRTKARQTAREYTWSSITPVLLTALTGAAVRQGLMRARTSTARPMNVVG